MALQVTASAHAMKLTGRSSFRCSRRRISRGLRPARFKLIKKLVALGFRAYRPLESRPRPPFGKRPRAALAVCLRAPSDYAPGHVVAIRPTRCRSCGRA
jgi:hypothetical protein